jgi:hypothetical protein
MHGMFHEDSGLHNEGNWHNCVMAMVYCRLADLLQEQQWLQLARRSMTSLYALNADTTGLLRTRSHSPYWDHTPLPNPRHEAYYQADSSRKFRSQAIAVISCSFLLGEPRIDHIYEQLSRPLLPTFWDEQERLWKTGEGAATYFRAVDAALGVISCARMLLAHRDAHVVSKANLRAALLASLDALRNRFGYKPPFKNVVTYIGKKQDGTFAWQDLWVYLAFATTARNDAEKADAALLLQWIADTYRAHPDRQVLISAPVGASWRQVYLNDNALYVGFARLGSRLGCFPPSLSLPAIVADYEALCRLALHTRPVSSDGIEAALLGEAEAEKYRKEVGLHAQSECAWALLLREVDWQLPAPALL